MAQGAEVARRLARRAGRGGGAGPELRAGPAQHPALGPGQHDGPRPVGGPPAGRELAVDRPDAGELQRAAEARLRVDRGLQDPGQGQRDGAGLAGGAAQVDVLPGQRPRPPTPARGPARAA
jgi:hypothetical protein